MRGDILPKRGSGAESRWLGNGARLINWSPGRRGVTESAVVVSVTIASGDDS